jgi:hypothetical protein
MARTNRTRSGTNPGTGTPQLTRADDAVHATRYLISATVAIAAAVMSYQALAVLNGRGGIADQWRWVWPVIVDGPHLAGALAVVAAQRRNQGAAWSWFLLAASTAASVAANVAASPPDNLSRVLHGAVPVVGFVLITDLCIGIRKRLEAAAAAEAPEAPAPPLPSAPLLPGPAALPAVIRVPVAEAAFPAPPRPSAPPASAAVPEADPAPAGTALRSVPKSGTTGTKSRAIDRHAEEARQWIAEEPGITGSEIGRRLGKSERYGRNVLAAATG